MNPWDFLSWIETEIDLNPSLVKKGYKIDYSSKDSISIKNLTFKSNSANFKGLESYDIPEEFNPNNRVQEINNYIQSWKEQNKEILLKDQSKYNSLNGNSIYNISNLEISLRSKVVPETSFHKIQFAPKKH